MQLHRKSLDGFRAIRASHGVRAAIETAWALARRTVRCSSRWVWSSSRPGLGRKGTRPRREGRAESVPEAGGTGAEAVATPTTPPAGHDAESRANAPASTGGDRWSAGEHPATGTWGSSDPAEVAELWNRERCRSGGFSGGIEGGRSTPRQSANVLHRVGWLTTTKGRETAPAVTSNTPLRASPGTASTEPSRASLPASWSKASRATRTSPFAVAMAALSADRRVPPYRTPSGTRHRRSQAIPRPVDSPQSRQADRERL